MRFESSWPHSFLFSATFIRGLKIASGLASQRVAALGRPFTGVILTLPPRGANAVATVRRDASLKLRVEPPAGGTRRIPLRTLIVKNLPPLGACWLALLTCSVLGNGGGYATGGVSETGSIIGFTPSGTEAVQILEENLAIALRPATASVQVRYLLKNVTDSPAKVRFGFPVEELNAHDELNEDGSSAENEDPAQVAKKGLQYCREYRVEASGRPIPAKFELQEQEAEAEERDDQRTGIRGWLISEITVPPGETTRLGISYLSDYPTESVHVSDDSRSSAKVFRYRLSTGAVWAGPIAKGTVTVRADGIRPEDLRILAPAGRFKRVDEAWQWSFENLEPTLADDLRIEAAPAENSYGYRNMQGGYGAGEDGSKPVSFVHRGDRWYVQHSNFATVKASSVLAPQNGIFYHAENVMDGNWDNVWAEGAKGGGAGEWIEAELEVPKALQSLTIVGGYQKDSRSFQNNARPKRVEVLLNGEHRFEADLPDAEGPTDLPVVGYDKPVEKLRLMIKEVYPGKNWQDCVITDLSVTTALDKAPDVQPAR